MSIKYYTLRASLLRGTKYNSNTHGYMYIGIPLESNFDFNCTLKLNSY